ncbi:MULTISPECIES: DNA-directed RNA polymerase subunit omega [unclassified Lentimicrobium]|uniref:DNA-directed RNA polymerase subunit omega n=1 Tax=unclassified Lentimicrobium TaxID=2677434 RepID=UPI001557764F|nr:MULTISPECIES: DNA-directed RNA polymerase subunit omega [unclassified Lentimicrobium]NPD45225.1 DNA-directed RNA polymerase subunit omega [Lentimicrobium sp. S6]NPD85404.1 DNA-directed RNA polymerase subunit omega [Lentimicrobium sp. L6]
MDYKKVKTDKVAVTRNLRDFDESTENIYESIAILAKRANQISKDLKEELNRKIEEFSTTGDNLEEVFENREQIEIAKFYERLPKPTLLAIQEFLEDEIYYRNPAKEVANNKIS